MFYHSGWWQVFRHEFMPRAIQTSAAAGGVTAALVSSLFRDSVVPTAPFVCPEFGLEDRIHWPSLCAGLVIGLVLGQLIELFILLRQFLSARIRFYVGVSSHNLAVKNRLCG